MKNTLLNVDKKKYVISANSRLDVSTYFCVWGLNLRSLLLNITFTTTRFSTYCLKVESFSILQNHVLQNEKLNFVSANHSLNYIN